MTGPLSIVPVEGMPTSALPHPRHAYLQAAGFPRPSKPLCLLSTPHTGDAPGVQTLKFPFHKLFKDVTVIPSTGGI